MRRFFIYIFTASASAFLSVSVYAQNDNVSGVINSYARVLDIDSCENTLFISTNKGFSEGDRVLIIQMQGASIDLRDSAVFGTVTTYNNAGNYEYAKIAKIRGLYITLVNKMLRQYDIAARVQIVRVPQYNNVTTVGTVLPIPWNGSVGGIVAFDASGTVTLQSDIDVSGAGFRGGDSSNNSGNNGNSGLTGFFYSDTSDKGGWKGESIAQYIADHQVGRGANANGGGGGNLQNAGGGGGSNFGAGGLGGDETDIVGRIPNGGLGGHPLDLTNKTKTFMGGGGGGGQCNDSRGSRGGAGGGLIIINADTIASTGGVIRSNGATARTASDMRGGDGAGGGGGGGTVILGASKMNGSLKIEILGGKGGDNNPPPNPKWCFAPGGGGGGGTAWISSAIVTSVTEVAGGGAAGLVLNNVLPCFNTTYGADSGRSGGVQFNPFFFEGTVPYSRPLATLDSAKICEGDTTQLGATGAISYKWSPSTGLDSDTSPTPKASPAMTTTYIVAMRTLEGCTLLDSVQVFVIPRPKPVISGDTDVCGNSIGRYKVKLIPGNTYSWGADKGQVIEQGADTATILWGNSPGGIVIVKMTPDSSGCTGIDSFPVLITPSLRPVVTGVRPMCVGDTLTLDAEAGYTSYKWSTGDTSRILKISIPGTYFVDVVGGKCTLRSDTFSVPLIPVPVPKITKSVDTIISPCDIASLTASAGYKAYLWSTGDTTQSISTRDSGWFKVSVVDSNGCSGLDSAYIGKLPNGATKFIIALDTLEGNTGDYVYYPLKMLSVVNSISNCEGDYTVTVHFNRTILVPEPPFISSRLLPKDRYVTFGNTLKLGDNANALPGIGFTVTLGDTSATPIVIDSFTWKGFEIEYIAHDGLFRTSNICYEGDGPRYSSNSGKINLIVPRPNPASGIVTIDYSTIEVGRTKLFITDLTGTIISILADGEHSVGRHIVHFNADNAANGRYFITLQTPTVVLHQALQVDH